MRLFISLAAALACALATACGGSSSDITTPTPPGGNTPTATPVTGVSVTAVSGASIRVSFTSRAGDTGYNIERAEGASGSFAPVLFVPAPSTATAVSVVDAGLKANTLYRYRVVTVVGTASSTPSSEVSATTLVVIVGNGDITTDITANRTLFADTAYTLKGFIHVTNGATLTIQPGATIKGDFNTLGSSLFIMRGARIVANGTADAPIVFTSSRAVGSRQPGDWGGIVIVGNAPISRSGSIALDGTGTDGAAVVGGKNYQVLYSGGTTATDNSGSMSYVRVEFAGNAPSADNGLSSFTFAAVGSNTHVSYLQSMAAVDDAFAFIGGALDGDHLVAYESGDDMYDMSEGFSGRLQFLVGYNSGQQLAPRSGAGTLSADIQGIESDGCFGSGCTNGFDQQPLTLPLVSNFTLIGCGALTCSGSGGGVGLMLRRGTGGYFVNGVVSRFPVSGITLRDLETYLRGGSVTTPNPATADLVLRNIHFSEISSTVFQANTTPVPTQFTLDLAGNALTNGVSISQSLFTSLPTPGAVPTGVSAFDWTPPAGVPIASGGMTSFTGRLFTKAGSFVTATSYLGAAAPGGIKWWTGWTAYVRN